MVDFVLWDIQITNHSSDINIVKAIISLAQAMNLNVIAEGIETQEQVKILTDLGCNFMQGYHFSKPLDFKNLLEMLKQQSS